MAHELRNPLSSAKLAWDLVVRKSEIDPRRAEVINRGLARLTELIDHSITRSRIKSGVDVRREPVAVDALIGEAQDIRLSTPRRRTSASPPTPRAHCPGRPPPAAVRATNLLRNAIKFTREGGRVSVRSRLAEGRVLIDVEDECGGLPPDRAEWLFAAFRQAGRDRSGFGLGLAISKQAIEAHGGTLSVKDVPEMVVSSRSTYQQPIQARRIDWRARRGAVDGSATGAIPAGGSARADPSAASTVGIIVVGVHARSTGTYGLSGTAGRLAPAEHAHLGAHARRRAVATVTAVRSKAGPVAAHQTRGTSAPFVHAHLPAPAPGRAIATVNAVRRNTGPAAAEQTRGTSARPARRRLSRRHNRRRWPRLPFPPFRSRPRFHRHCQHPQLPRSPRPHLPRRQRHFHHALPPRHPPRRRTHHRGPHLRRWPHLSTPCRHHRRKWRAPRRGEGVRMREARACPHCIPGTAPPDLRADAGALQQRQRGRDADGPGQGHRPRPSPRKRKAQQTLVSCLLTARRPRIPPSRDIPAAWPWAANIRGVVACLRRCRSRGASPNRSSFW